jgi:Tol biopolymer transport system component
MSRCVRGPRAYAALLFLLASCGGDDDPTGPAAFARGGAAAPLTATPVSLALAIPAAAAAKLTASVQYSGTITASTSDAACATVGPLEVPTTKPRGSSVYVATFNVSPIGAGTCVITLTDKRGASASVPVVVRHAIPLDGSKLVFASDRDGNTELYLSNPDGSNPVRLTTTAAAEQDPVLSPDRTTIVFASDETGTLNLFMMRIDGSARQQLTFYDDGDDLGAVEPAFSPDGRQIAFSYYPSAGLPLGVPINVMDAIPGSTPVQITDGTTINHEPRYAPDGRIIFASAEEGDLFTSLYIMYGNGASRTRLTNSASGGEGSPSVSPDGRTVAFPRGNGVDDTEIWLMDIDGTNQRPLTANAVDDTHPVFSPDGAWIAFSSRRDGVPDHLVMKLDRPEAEAWNITNSTSREFPVDWR